MTVLCLTELSRVCARNPHPPRNSSLKECGPVLVATLAPHVAAEKCRDSRIRTYDPLLPKQVRCQSALCPENNLKTYDNRGISILNE